MGLKDRKENISKYWAFYPRQNINAFSEQSYTERTIVKINESHIKGNTYFRLLK